MPLDYIERRFDLFHLGQYLLVLDDIFIRGQQDIKLPAAELRHKPTTQSRSTLQWGTHKEQTILCSEPTEIRILCFKKNRNNRKSFSYLVRNFYHRGCPLVKFIDPVRQSPGKK